MLADAHVPAAPGVEGVTSDTVARAVIAAIDDDRGEVDAADAAVRIPARFGGPAPGLIARLTNRKDALPTPTN